MSRLFRTHVPAELVVGAFLLAGVAAGACSAPTAVDIDPASNGPAKQDSQGGAGNDSPLSPPAPADASTTPYRGNPLCYPSPGATPDFSMCAPDQGACGAPVGYDASGAPTLGCRIARDDRGGAEVLPRCLDAGPNGTDGATCERGADCAAGFDCVVGATGVRSCRHYCCAGTCKGNLSNESATFCDVETLVDVNQKAPVCMPIKHCNRLLGTGECNAQESCTVVTESGDTGCLTVGDVKVGGSCDTAHCAAQLACLGQAGARRCFQLCDVSKTDCASGQTCITSAAFKDASFGICQ